MTQIPSSEGSAQPLRPDPLLQKAAQPQRPAEGTETEPATRRLAEQSHTLELSKSRMPASELAALKVHFGEQQSAKATAQTFAPAELGSDFRQGESHPIYGQTTPRKRIILPPNWPRDMDGRLIYGQTTPRKREDELKPKDKEPQQRDPKVVPDEPPSIFDWPNDRRRPKWMDSFRWPDDMGMHQVYGLSGLRKLDF